MKRVLLVGNPNVGKSAIFSRLTGIHASVSNYPGTTVTYKTGCAKIGDETFEVVDTPGTYSLDWTNEAEKVTSDLLDSGHIVINVLDATNLERNLLMTMQLLERGVPLIVGLNMFDDAQHKGIHIDVPRLAEYLRVPVVPVVGISGFGIKDLAQQIAGFAERVERQDAFTSIHQHSPSEKWADIGEIVGRVQNLEHRHHTFLERLQDASTHPAGGLAFAVFVLLVSFAVVRAIGEGLISLVLDPVFEGAYKPILVRLSGTLASKPFLHHLLIGKLVDGDIDFVQAMGMLTTGLYVPLAMVLPYILAFYLVLSIMEDIGYLPRLGVLLDALMHKIGMHGFCVIPMLLGLGCNVPGILATRSLETKRQRFIASTLISIGVPCVSLQAMVFKLVGDHGLGYVVWVYAFLAAVILVLGAILRRLIKGVLPELILEIPPYRLPGFRATCHKLFYRCRGFIYEAIPLVLLGVLLVNILDYIGIFEFCASVTAPVVSRIWGLPQEAILPLAMGFLRKDIAAGLLVPLSLSLPQLMTASVLLSLSFPCIATFAILFSELGWRNTLKSIGIMVLSAIVFGGLARVLFAALAS